MSPIPYKETTEDGYAAAFAASASATPIRRGVLLSGACPRCGDRMEFPVVTEIFQTAGSGPGGDDADSPLLCTCLTAHPDRPEDEEGCGAYWNIRLTTA
jgi:hypothetical protein